MLFTRLQKEAKNDMKAHMIAKKEEHERLLAKARAREEISSAFKEAAVSR